MSRLAILEVAARVLATAVLLTVRRQALSDVNIKGKELLTIFVDYCASGCQSAYGICNAEAPVSNTGSCGTNNGGACTGGLCCSGAGWCGNTTDYCLTSNGCQTAFGLCNADAPASPDGNTCGPQNGNTICPDSQCCSVSGFCGTTADFCSDPNNCAPGFGRCDSDTTPAGASTQNVARPLLGSVVYGDDVYDCVSSKVVALSFDDG